MSKLKTMRIRAFCWAFRLECNILFSEPISCQLKVEGEKKFWASHLGLKKQTIWKSINAPFFNQLSCTTHSLKGFGAKKPKRIPFLHTALTHLSSVSFELQLTWSVQSKKCIYTYCYLAVTAPHTCVCPGWLLKRKQKNRNKSDSQFCLVLE